MRAEATRPSRYEITAWIVTAVLLVLTLWLGLLPALLAGLLVYELVHLIAPRLRLKRAAKLAAVGLIAVAVVLLLCGVLVGVLAVLHSGSLPRLLTRMAEIIGQTRGNLPDWVANYLPEDADSVREETTRWLHEHAAELRQFGGEFGRVLLRIVIGLVIGAIVSLREADDSAEGGPLERALAERAQRLGEAFRRVVFAQVRIAALNAFFTAIYIVGVLPLLGIQLPFAKTLVIITFVGGLIPIVGNLVANTVIVVMSLNVSLTLAIASLVFLVSVHKLEYFLNARIVGRGINAASWELLVAMLLMESAFGLPGLVAAPIFYAYVKDELTARGLI